MSRIRERRKRRALKRKMQIPSQACADDFAKQLAKRMKMHVKRKTPTYLEIGAGMPAKYSNTKELEIAGWQGLSIDKAKTVQNSWDREASKYGRSNDRLIMWDWLDIHRCKRLNEIKDKHFTYVSLDIDPPNTLCFKGLEKLFEIGVTFDFLTYEHNLYMERHKEGKRDNAICKENGYKLLTQMNYRRIADNVGVWGDPNAPFEDWYVSPRIDLPEFNHHDWYKTIRPEQDAGVKPRAP